MTPSTMTGVEVDELHDLADLRGACDLFISIWGRGNGDPPVAPELLRALGHAGGYVAGARRNGELVGASVGFVGLEGRDVILHSHITGVGVGAQGLGVGAALKRHQRRWAIARGINTITWTFDPLVRRNGRFNLQTLGAEAVAYLPDFYGVMNDAQNGSDATDRCLVRWELQSTDQESGSPEPDVAQLLAKGAAAVLRPDDDGAPAVTESGADIRLCWIPDDVVSLRSTDPDAAAQWRVALRTAMGDAMAAGLRGVGVSRDGWYVMAASREVLR